MKSAYRFSPVLLLGLFLSGCKFPTAGESAPTFIPEDHLPTAVALTADAFSEEEVSLLQQTINPFPGPTAGNQQPSATAVPSQTPRPQITADPATSTPTLEITLEDPQPIQFPDPLPYARIQMISPGPLSRVTSPFNIHAYLDPGEKRQVQVSLYGEDERLLVRHQVSFQDSQSQKVHLKMDLSFEISENAETARLEVSTKDPYGRVTALSSTDVILLAEGEPGLNAPLDLYENIIIQQPITSNLIQGDSLIVKGFTRHAPQELVVVHLLNRQGGMVGSKVIEVESEDIGGGYRFFAGEVPFLVGSSSWIRVQVLARDGRFSGVQHLSSVEVLVSP